MTIRRVVPNITTDRMDVSKKFYVEILGFEVAMDMGWIVTLASPSNPTAQISLIKGESPDRDAEKITLSIEVAAVEAVHATAVERGHEIIYPLTVEPWGVRRFHVRDPNGVVLNVLTHVPKD